MVFGWGISFLQWQFRNLEKSELFQGVLLWFFLRYGFVDVVMFCLRLGLGCFCFISFYEGINFRLQLGFRLVVVYLRVRLGFLSIWLFKFFFGKRVVFRSFQLVIYFSVGRVMMGFRFFNFFQQVKFYSWQGVFYYYLCFCAFFFFIGRE